MKIFHSIIYCIGIVNAVVGASNVDKVRSGFKLMFDTLNGMKTADGPLLTRTILFNTLRQAPTDQELSLSFQKMLDVVRREASPEIAVRIDRFEDTLRSLNPAELRRIVEDLAIEYGVDASGRRKREDGVTTEEEDGLGDQVTLEEEDSLGEEDGLEEEVTVGEGVTSADGVTSGDGVSLGDEVTLSEEVTSGEEVIPEERKAEEQSSSEVPAVTTTPEFVTLVLK